MSDPLHRALASLPPSASVAVVQFVGSFCPITLGHVQCLQEAKKMLMEPNAFEMRRSAVIATIHVNSDAHVSEKLRGQGEPSLSASNRRHLCRLATDEHASWIRVVNEGEDFLKELKARYRQLQFTVWKLNGADDVVKYQKWQSAGPQTPHITMGRPGVPMHQLQAHVGPHFKVGPELPDISSSVARSALAQGDYDQVQSLLHPRVDHWCKKMGPWQPAATPGPAPRPVQTTVASPHTTEQQPRARQRVPAVAVPSPAALAVTEGAGGANPVVKAWTTDGVSAFLCEIGLAELVDEFRLNSIDGAVLVDLIARDQLNVILPNAIHASRVRTNVQKRGGSACAAAAADAGAGSQSGGALVPHHSSRAPPSNGQTPHRSTQQGPKSDRDNCYLVTPPAELKSGHKIAAAGVLVARKGTDGSIEVLVCVEYRVEGHGFRRVLNLLGGKADAADRGNALHTAAREFCEETGSVLKLDLAKKALARAQRVYLGFGKYALFVVRPKEHSSQLNKIHVNYNTMWGLADPPPGSPRSTHVCTRLPDPIAQVLVAAWHPCRGRVPHMGSLG